MLLNWGILLRLLSQINIMKNPEVSKQKKIDRENRKKGIKTIAKKIIKTIVIEF